jgi:hypothetical protein
MNKTMNLVLLITAVIAVTVTSASAQAPTPLSKNIFVDFNFGVQPASRTFSIESFPIVYGEAAIINANQDVDGSGLVDLMGGYRVWRDLSVAVGWTGIFASKNSAEVVGSIPHPLFFDSRVESTVTVEDLEHKEQSVHLSVMWTSPVTDKIDASVFAGPSYVKVSQDLITSVNVPAGTQTFTPVSSQETDTVWGFHLGADITYLITPHIGAGAILRIVNATAHLPSVPDLDVAGFQIGGGVRIRF